MKAKLTLGCFSEFVVLEGWWCVHQLVHVLAAFSFTNSAATVKVTRAKRRIKMEKFIITFEWNKKKKRAAFMSQSLITMKSIHWCSRA
jgi:hypothetical protein